MSTNIVFLLLLIANYCQEENSNETQAKPVNVEQPPVLEIKKPAESLQEKVDTAQFHPKATNGEDTIPPLPKTQDITPQVEQDKPVEPQILGLEIPKDEEKQEEEPEEKPAMVETKTEESKTVKSTEEVTEKKEEEEEKVKEQKVEEKSLDTVTDKVGDKVEDVPVEEKKDAGEGGGEGVIPSFQEFKESQIKKDSEKESVNKVAQEPEAAKEVVKKRKKVEKNYADSACGAKIVARNKESKNTAALLNSNRDLYVMNPCDVSIWFVVELCDTVQVEALQLANFELFSSSIENFNVFTSSSYPTKQWTQVGPFTAKNNRNLQKFQLTPDREYSKFVKFEKISHYVKEHFCVMTTFQVLGTSMVEEYEGQQPDEVEDEIDPYEESLDGSDKRRTTEDTGDKSIMAGARDLANNILGSAMNLLSGSSGDTASQNLTNKTTATAPEVIDNKVVVKVDEAGKEIKDDVPEITQADKLRLKGETGDLTPPKKDIKPIMEPVNLKEEEEDVAEIKPAEEPAPIEAVLPVVEKHEEVEKRRKHEEVEKKEEILEPIKEEEPTPEKEPKEITGDKEELKGKVEDMKGKDDAKGVIMSSSPKKNSIFVELDKKIKDLEYNLSLSNDYLETLSSRYKKVNNLFKPLEKTLSTFDDTMKKFEGRLELLEASISALNNTIQRQIDVQLDGQESNMNLSTSLNIILFFLTVIMLLCWRITKKITSLQQTMLTQRIPFAPPVPIQKTLHTDYQLSNIENIDPKSKGHVSVGRQSVDIGTKKKKAKQKIKKDPITSAGLLFDSSGNKNLPTTTTNNMLRHSKSTESLPVELIFPHYSSDLIKRKVKFKQSH